MTLLTSSENDEEVNISQSVRDLNSNLFDAIENEILTIENQEAGHGEELDTASQGMHDAVEASTEAIIKSYKNHLLRSSFIPFTNTVQAVEFVWIQQRIKRCWMLEYNK